MIKIHEYIGVDLGSKKSGIARGNNIARLAEPIMVIETSQLVSKLNKLAKHNLAGIVFGLPRNLNGNDTKQTQWVRDWIKRARPALPAKIYLQDESLTTHMATDSSRFTASDADAAALILQDFLDGLANDKIRD